jgi:hypothetical protein
MYIKHTGHTSCWCTSGKCWQFGGDTDNWEWPRYTGDFSILGICNKDGKPADYGKDNVPLNQNTFAR